MTVASLWKVLDAANCGKRIGIEELKYANPDSRPAKSINPWNFNRSIAAKNKDLKPATLAVDLSIWICESLTSRGMNDQHANPTLHLVFTRVTKLLENNIKIVVVIEGKRRIRCADGENEQSLRKRRSGTAFWKACNDCEKMLQMLGVPVVRAKAEGEALCALLNQRDIVDGVISNDGDCLLFGAKVIYTKFTLENLENNNVVRYDSNDLHALIKQGDDKDIEVKELGKFQLSRSDLISFAVLTGSDLAGPGMHKVGYMKAVRFIRKCQLDNPLVKDGGAALSELQSWARSALVSCYVDPNEIAKSESDTGKLSRCCSRCSHGGTKRNHLKNGCAICETAPGEPCHEVTCEDKFRMFLRSKALAMKPKFDPSYVHDTYMAPNDHQLPIQFARKHKSSTLFKIRPQLGALMQSSLIVKGWSYVTSREYVKRTVGRLLSRIEIETDDCQQDEQQNSGSDGKNSTTRERPVPIKIVKSLVKHGVECFEVEWHVKATFTDAGGEEADGYDYNTIEPQSKITKKWPRLVESFASDEKEKKKQGDGEQVRRREFIDMIIGHQEASNVADDSNGDPPLCVKDNYPKKKKVDKQRGAFFNHAKRHVKAGNIVSKTNLTRNNSDEANRLLKCVIKPNPLVSNKRSRADTIENVMNKKQCIVDDTHTTTTASMTDDSSSTSCDSACDLSRDEAPLLLDYGFDVDDNHSVTSDTIASIESKTDTPLLPALTPSKPIYCKMGSFYIEVTPVETQTCMFPPKHIIIRTERG